jgi:hypothetical protein
MEEFMFWLVIFFRGFRFLFPFLIGGLAALFAFNLLGTPPAPFRIPISLFITLMVGIELKRFFKLFSNESEGNRGGKFR